MCNMTEIKTTHLDKTPQLASTMSRGGERYLVEPEARGSRKNLNIRVNQPPQVRPGEGYTGGSGNDVPVSGELVARVAPDASVVREKLKGIKVNSISTG